MLQQLCELVYNASFELRKNNKQADGLAFWKPIKAILEKYDNVHDKTAKWKEPDIVDGREFYGDMDVEYIMSLEEFDNLGELIELVHFQKQLVRIPKGQICLRKIVQLALNKGQYDGTIYTEPSCFRKICCCEKNSNFGFDVTIYLDENSFIENSYIEKIIETLK